MYKIGICDSNEEFCWKAEEYLIDYCMVKKLPITTQVFLTGKELLEFVAKEGPLNLLFLNCRLKDINGIEVGKKIRNHPFNEITQIVYVSSKINYSINCFQVRPIDFLLKPITPNDIKRIIDTYCQLFIQNKTHFEYKCKKKVCRIDIDYIMYFQSKGKIVHIYTTFGENSFYGKLSDTIEILKDSNFLSIHKSFFVNPDYIAEYHFHEVILTDGTIIPISQSMRNCTKERILQHNATPY